MVIENRNFFDERLGKDPIVSTMRGDSAIAIGDGKECLWDFSNANDIVIDSITTTIPVGFKRKRIELQFVESTFILGEKIFFEASPFGMYLDMWKISKNTGHYEDPNGLIRGNTINLDPDKMYTLSTSDTPVTHFVNNYFLSGDNRIGTSIHQDINESFGLRERGDSVAIWIELTTQNADVLSNGFIEFVLRRKRSLLLPGESI